MHSYLSSGAVCDPPPVCLRLVQRRRQAFA
jgi:hypothetical protein